MGISAAAKTGKLSWCPEQSAHGRGCAAVWGWPKDMARRYEMVACQFVKRLAHQQEKT